MNTFKSRHHGIDITSALHTPINTTICHFCDHLWSWYIIVLGIHKLGHSKFLGYNKPFRIKVNPYNS
nr:hypothetical protein Iba_chr12bCG22280 [Ipomoea batatas]